MQLDLHVPASLRHLLQMCLTSLQEFKQRQHSPVQKQGNNKMHQAQEADPCSCSMSVIVRSLQESQFISTGNRACLPDVG